MNSVEAFQHLNNYTRPLLIDVRTSNEWHETGVPNMENAQLIQLSIQKDDSTAYKEDFANQLHSAITKLNQFCADRPKYDKNSPLFFLCGAGIRSHVAANIMIEFGYNNCHNITDGCWGSDMGDGWIANNLPWKKN